MIRGIFKLEDRKSNGWKLFVDNFVEMRPHRGHFECCSRKNFMATNGRLRFRRPLIFPRIATNGVSKKKTNSGLDRRCSIVFSLPLINHCWTTTLEGQSCKKLMKSVRETHFIMVGQLITLKWASGSFRSLKSLKTWTRNRANRNSVLHWIPNTRKYWEEKNSVNVSTCKVVPQKADDAASKQKPNGQNTSNENWNLKKKTPDDRWGEGVQENPVKKKPINQLINVIQHLFVVRFYGITTKKN